MEKLLIASYFSFSHDVSISLVHQNAVLYGNGLMGVKNSVTCVNNPSADTQWWSDQV